jgi:hypothetical protein
MPRFQLEVATALAVGALCSLSIFYLSRPKEGKITLPTHSDYEEVITEDPFDVITPEDVLEGYPIDERKFWDQVRCVLCVSDDNHDFLALVGTGTIQKTELGPALLHYRRNRNYLHWMVCCE